MDKKHIRVVSCIVILMFFFSCGKKEWPRPIKEEDSFKFSNLSATYRENCIVVKGDILGNIHNLREILLEIEMDNNICPKCPFSPNLTIKYLLSSPSIKLLSNSFVLTYCQNKRHNVSRLRVIGINKFYVLGPVFSQIVEVKK